MEPLTLADSGSSGWLLPISWNEFENSFMLYMNFVSNLFPTARTSRSRSRYTLVTRGPPFARSTWSGGCVSCTRPVRSIRSYILRAAGPAGRRVGLDPSLRAVWVRIQKSPRWASAQAAPRPRHPAKQSSWISFPPRPRPYAFPVSDTIWDRLQLYDSIIAPSVRLCSVVCIVAELILYS